jgi:5-methylcytosine-specific restriction endonuclease McrA
MPPDVPRSPLCAAISGTPGERRLNRLKPPACSECGHDDSRVTLRTDYVVTRNDAGGLAWCPGSDTAHGVDIAS